MAEYTAQKATPRGIGARYDALPAGVHTMPSSRTGIAHVRNRAGAGGGDLVLSVTVDENGGSDGLGPRTVSMEVPAQATRFIGLVPKLGDVATGVITFTVSGDASNADIAVLERA